MSDLGGDVDQFDLGASERFATRACAPEEMGVRDEARSTNSPIGLPIWSSGWQ